MKKKLLAILVGICLIAVSVVAFTACGESELGKPSYPYYYFDLSEDGNGLVLSVSNRNLLLSEDLTLPTQSYYYPDVAGGEEKEHDVPKDVVKIADGAFKGFDKLKSVTIGNTYRELGEGCFEKCTSLTTVAFPSTKKNDEAGKIAIPANAFNGCTELKSITGNTVVTAVGDRAFYECIKLSSMEFQWENGYVIGEEAFFYTASLHNFDASKAGKVGKDAFKGSAVQEPQAKA